MIRIAEPELKLLKTYDVFIKNIFNGSELIKKIKCKSKILIRCNDEIAMIKTLSCIQKITKPLSIVDCSTGKYNISESKNGYIFKDIDKLNDRDRENLFSKVFTTNDFKNKYLIFTSSTNITSIYEKYFYNFPINSDMDGLKSRIFLYLLFEKGLVKEPPFLDHFIFYVVDSVIELFPSTKEMDMFLDEEVYSYYHIPLYYPFFFWYALYKYLIERYGSIITLDISDLKSDNKWHARKNGSKIYTFKYYRNKWLMYLAVLAIIAPLKIDPVTLYNLVEDYICTKLKPRLKCHSIDKNSKLVKSLNEEAANRIQGTRREFIAFENNNNNKVDFQLLNFLSSKEFIHIGSNEADCFIDFKDNTKLIVNDPKLKEFIKSKLSETINPAA